MDEGLTDPEEYMGGGAQTPTKKKSKVKRSKSRAGSRTNCCYNLIRRIFTKMYPAKPVFAANKQAIWMRKIFKWAMFSHCLFFIFGLFLVGFISTIANLVLAALAQSGGLTLKYPVIIIYFIFLLSNMGYAVKISLF